MQVLVRRTELSPYVALMISLLMIASLLALLANVQRALEIPPLTSLNVGGRLADAIQLPAMPTRPRPDRPPSAPAAEAPSSPSSPFPAEFARLGPELSAEQAVSPQIQTPEQAPILPRVLQPSASSKKWMKKLPPTAEVVGLVWVSPAEKSEPKGSKEKQPKK